MLRQMRPADQDAAAKRAAREPGGASQTAGSAAARELAPDDDPWRAGREAARREVAAALAPRRRACPSCDAEVPGGGPHPACPSCGAPLGDRHRAAFRPGEHRRALGLAAALALAVAAVAVAVVAPAVRDAKARDQARERAATAAAVRAEVARLRADQALHAAAGRPAGGRPAARAALLATLEREITADARARVRARTVDARAVQRTTCQPFPTTPTQRARERAGGFRVGHYACLAITATADPIPTGPGATIGIPFRARVDYATGRLAWCKTNPPPGERGVQALAPQVPLPAGCTRP